MSCFIIMCDQRNVLFDVRVQLSTPVNRDFDHSCMPVIAPHAQFLSLGKSTSPAKCRFSSVRILFPEEQL